MNSPFPVPDGIYRATFAVIDLDAIAHNLRALRSLLPRSVSICAVVKADAYGHGAVPVSRELEAQEVEAFCVATVEEGVELRRAGIQRPIMVLGVGFSGLESAQKYGLAPVIYSPGTAQRISEATRRMKKPLSVHLKIDTGMGRLGLLAEEWHGVLKDLLANPWIELEGMATHFSSADSDAEFTRMQLDRFHQAVEQARGIREPPATRIHAANSAGLVNHPESAFTMVRPGLLLYGSYPEPGLRDKVTVRPAMTFRTQVLYVKSLPTGSPVSYGQTFHTKRASRIATLAMGYADGYRRDLSNRGWVLIRGRSAPVVGNVTMDLTMVDVTDIPETSEGDEVILFGPGQGTCLPVEDLAEEIGTISYELLCAVSRRVPRIYTRGGKIVDVP
jgi:alanine racemase